MARCGGASLSGPNPSRGKESKLVPQLPPILLSEQSTCHLEEQSRSSTSERVIDFGQHAIQLMTQCLARRAMSENHNSPLLCIRVVGVVHSPVPCCAVKSEERCDPHRLFRHYLAAEGFKGEDSLIFSSPVDDETKYAEVRNKGAPSRQDAGPPTC
jgi:hypothetical protein